MARPAHQPTAASRQLAEKLSGIGLSHELVAAAMDLDDKTLRKYYAAELRRAKALRLAKVAQVVFNKAQKGNLGAAMFILKTQAGWSEKQQVEVSGQEGAPLGVIVLPPKAEP